jgi:hypothetical protein
MEQEYDYEPDKGARYERKDPDCLSVRLRGKFPNLDI